MTVSWRFYFTFLLKDQTITSARITPQSIRPHLCESLTHAQSTCFSFDFIPLFLAGLITGILHGRELTPSAGPSRAWFSGHWASGSPPSHHSAGTALGPSSGQRPAVTGGLVLQQKASVLVWGLLIWGHPEQQRGPILHRG